MIESTGTCSIGEHPLGVEDCRAQLSLILNSADFDATGREHRFLGYVVEEALSGRGDRIKAYSIAVEVFGRGESFDPQTDPIVRIEAGHLRRALERYYLTSGQADPILIAIPKGGYIPVFSRREQMAVAQPPAPIVSPKVAERAAQGMAWRLLVPTALVAILLAVGISASAWWRNSTRPGAPEKPRVLVEAFDDAGGTLATGAVASGLKGEIVEQLSKFREILVMESAPKAGDTTIFPPRFVLAGGVTLSADAFMLRVRLINQADNSILWAKSYNGPLKVAAFTAAQTEIANSVSKSLAQTHGVIARADENLDVSKPPDDWAAYVCTLSFYGYRLDIDPERRSSARTCLEQAVARFPSYATAWGLLSLVYIDDYRFEFSADPASSATKLERALAAAGRAMELDPSDMRARQAKMLALYFDQQVEAALTLGKESLEINPNDTEFLGEYGERLAVSGNWKDGCPMITESRQQNPGASAYYETDLALCSYFGGDYLQAAMWLERTPAPRNPIYHLTGAAIFGEAGNAAKADRERAWLEQNQPELVKNLRQQLSKRLGRPQDAEFMIGSLKKAGLKIAD
ncbi:MULTISPECIES: hypothetical protein [Mesorhizobium]|uniref:Uncharacterized protein n=1 Tax=Mesorhizobium japonicum TaxID=2066070 RepID=A0A3M9XEH8_9HYPH|nr:MULTISPECIES: hypothetical protein [Mesorhizobium]RNJ46275.1 hypothetical protein DNR46_10345 [Mesorhizobium japonicum]